MKNSELLELQSKLEELIETTLKSENYISDSGKEACSEIFEWLRKTPETDRHKLGILYYKSVWSKKNALSLAIEQNHIPLVKLLLDKYNFDQNSKFREGGATPIIFHVRSIEMAKLLIDRQADLDVKYGNLDTPNKYVKAVIFKKTNPHPSLEELPLHSEQLKKELTNPNKYDTRTGYMYDQSGSRIARHEIATKALHFLYSKGANAINKSPRLLEEYNALPTTFSDKCRDQLKSLLIMWAGLNWMTPKEISKLCENLNKNNMALMTSNIKPVEFPNGGGFDNEHAISIILILYISNNESKFNVLSDKEATPIKRYQVDYKMDQIDNKMDMHLPFFIGDFILCPNPNDKAISPHSALEMGIHIFDEMSQKNKMLLTAGYLKKIFPEELTPDCIAKIIEKNISLPRIQIQEKEQDISFPRTQPPHKSYVLTRNAIKSIYESYANRLFNKSGKIFSSDDKEKILQILHDRAQKNRKKGKKKNASSQTLTTLKPRNLPIALKIVYDSYYNKLSFFSNTSKLDPRDEIFNNNHDVKKIIDKLRKNSKDDPESIANKTLKDFGL